MKLTAGDRRTIKDGMTKAAPLVAILTLVPLLAMGANPLWALLAGPAVMGFILGAIFLGNEATAGPDDRHWRDRL